MKYFSKSQLVIFLVLAILVVLPIQVGAEEEASYFQNGEKKEQLTGTKEIIVNNGDINSEISIIEKGQEVFNRELSTINIASIENSTIDNQEYLIIAYRYQGSSNALFFEVLKLDESGALSIYNSDIFERARLDVEGNQILLNYPTYEEGAAMTEPAGIVSQAFSIANESVVEGNSRLEKTGTSNNKLKATVTDTNPQDSEINDMLTEEAINAGVSPEIVKAIALQESSWQQYWEVVPESVRSCDNYDGTNVKLGYDCIGIGIMQISDQIYMDEGTEKEAYIERLKTDTRFNIQEGIRILKEKWDYHKAGIIPTINDNNPLVIENWYFAVMAYNGMLPRNNPLERPYSPNGAYQEEVFKNLADYTLLDINPFPTHRLDPYETEKGQLRFETSHFEVTGPQHLSSQTLVKGNTAYTTAPTLNFRDAPNGKVIGSLPKGSRVSITADYVGNNSKYGQYIWYPITTDSGKSGWVASSYLAQKDYIDVYSLQGYSRYDTSVSIANNGWHWDQPSSVVIGRGDDPIDALTGSVLASSMDSPLLLTQTSQLPDSVEKELDRLKPSGIIYLLGGENVISLTVENQLKEKFGNSNVKRIAGFSRFDTAYQVANEVANNVSDVNEIFVTTGASESSDPLAIAPYAGENNIPILLTGRSNGEELNETVSSFIAENDINKVTIIGGSLAVSSSAEAELKNLVGTGNVKRVYGTSRFDTNISIIDEYYEKNDMDRLLVAQGMETADSLSASPFAAKLESPILLTLDNRVPPETLLLFPFRNLRLKRSV